MTGLPGQMSFTLERKGGRYWHLSEREGKRLDMSKARLGEFCYEVLKRGGDIIQLWPFAPQYHRSAVYPIVAMTQEQRDKFAEETGYILVAPPIIKLNQS